MQSRTPASRKDSLSHAQRILSFFGKKKPYAEVAKRNWKMKQYETDYDKVLERNKHIHSWLLRQFGRRGINGLNITQFGAGHGQYMDFLKRHYKSNTIAVENDSRLIQKGKDLGVEPNYLNEHVHGTSIPPSSQDVVLSYHFLFANYHKINDEMVLAETSRILKKGGFLVVQESFVPNEELMQKHGLKRVDNEHANLLVFQKVK